MRGRGGFNRGGGGGDFHRGGGGGRGGRGGFNRERGGGRDFSNSKQIEIGVFDHKTELGTVVYKLSSSNGNVPLTQTFLFDSRGNQIGKIADVYGPLTEVYLNAQFDDPKYADKVKEGDKVYAPEDRCRPEEFFTSDQTAAKRGGGGRGGRGGGRGGGGRGRGGAPRGRGRF